PRASPEPATASHPPGHDDRAQDHDDDHDDRPQAGGADAHDVAPHGPRGRRSLGRMMRRLVLMPLLAGLLACGGAPSGALRGSDATSVRFEGGTAVRYETDA